MLPGIQIDTCYTQSASDTFMPTLCEILIRTPGFDALSAQQPKIREKFLPTALDLREAIEK